ncbi:Developmentally-regulated GTP-binding protein 2 [Irineochytrium annulatum]|nr:Developmentally-regulated GTP-binding protein 2 [Irineochytrium annulatum]
MGILEKIADIEAEMARTQKNKATEYHLGLLKAKLAKYRTMLLEPQGKSGPKGPGFDVVRSGDARVALIGFPSVGKSTLLSKVTGTTSEAASYEFTTLTCIPGKIHYNGAAIQLLDLPGIIEGASQGKGRGRQVIAVAKTADLILMMLDATKGPRQRELLEIELEAVGIRINAAKPNIYFKVKKGGGVSFNATCKLTHLNERLVQQILQSYKIHNAEVLIREDHTVDEFIDVVLGNRKYIRCVYCYNKIDQISLEEVDRLARQPFTVVISCESDLNMDYLIEYLWKNLGLIRVYTKRRGEFPDFEGGLILRSGSSVMEVCRHIHKSLAEEINVIDHYENPRNVGSLSKADPNVGTGVVGAPACGDVMKLQILVDDASGEIKEVKFKTFGCGSAIASSSLVTEKIKGMKVWDAAKVKNTEIARELSLPPVKLHCSMLAEDAIKSAIKDWETKRAATGRPALEAS